MLTGAREALGARLASALLITKPGHFDPEISQDARITSLAGGHPLPDAASLVAGDRLLAYLHDLPAGQPVLFLLSGGTSSLVEVPAPGVGLALLQRANRWLLGSGLDIHAVNCVRRALSAIKGGRLCRYLAGRPARVLLVSDVSGDDPASIGSGPLYAAAGVQHDLPELPDWLVLPAAAPATPVDAPVPHTVVASLDQALAAGAARARELGYPATVMPGTLAGPAAAAGRHLVQSLLDAGPGVRLWGGETTVVLPPQPGQGGRNQHLALAAALALQGRQDILLLAAGTDGNDGNTQAAGAIVDGGTVVRAAAAGRDAARALREADAGGCLAAAGDLLVTGPTGTNVTDLAIGLKLDD
jgi:hydroxypyruvate reductase